VGKEAVTELEIRLEITDKGNFDEYLGVKVKKQSNNNYKLSPLLLIEQILKAMDFNEQTKPRDIPALSSKILNRDLERQTHDTTWDYRQILAQLNFLEKSTRPDINYTVHQ